MNPLPPQAYTRETLVSAYNWLLSQGEHVKELAATPDALVSLYLKAQREGSEALDRPSVMNFRSELRNLSGMLGDLDQKANTGAGTTGPNVSQKPSNIASQKVAVPRANLESSAAHQVDSSKARARENEPQSSNASLSKVQVFENSDSSKASPIHDFLDQRSIVLVHEIKAISNLSSDAEVLRMLITLGYSRAKKIFSDESK